MIATGRASFLFPEHRHFRRCMWYINDVSEAVPTLVRTLKGRFWTIHLVWQHHKRFWTAQDCLNVWTGLQRVSKPSLCLCRSLFQLCRRFWNTFSPFRRFITTTKSCLKIPYYSYVPIDSDLALRSNTCGRRLLASSRTWEIVFYVSGIHGFLISM